MSSLLTQILQLSRHPGKLLAGIMKVGCRVFVRDPGQKLAGMTAQKSFQTLVSNVQLTEKFRLKFGKHFPQRRDGNHSAHTTLPQEGSPRFDELVQFQEAK